MLRIVDTFFNALDRENIYELQPDRSYSSRDDRRGGDRGKIQIYSGEEEDRRYSRKRESSRGDYSSSKRRKEDDREYSRNYRPRDYDNPRGNYHYDQNLDRYPPPPQMGWGMPQYHMQPGPMPMHDQYNMHPPYDPMAGNYLPGKREDTRRKIPMYKGGKDPNATKLTIGSIPKELNTLDQLNTHFSKFGEVVNIEVFPQYGKANVQFSDHQSAQDAISSPDSVLGNRFIKIYWSPPEKGDGNVREYQQTPRPPKPEKRKPIAPEQTKYVSEEYKQKMEEEEKVNKEKREALQEKINTCKESLNEVYARLNGEELEDDVRDELQKKKFELKEEKRSLLTEFHSLSSTLPRDALLKSHEFLKSRIDSSYRGRGRGRGTFIRGRGRGGFVRGRGGYLGAQNSGRSLSLDNRPKSLLIKNLHKEEDIRSHFEVYMHLNCQIEINLTLNFRNLVR